MPDNGIAVEPREAQRPTSLAARTPKRRPLVTGKRRGCAAGLRYWPAKGCRSAAPWRLPALHPLPFGGKKEKGIRAYPGPGKLKNTSGGALANGPALR